MSVSLGRLRAIAATIALLTGVALAASPWLLAASPALLMTGLSGTAYLVLALGLCGTSRFSLFVGILLPLLRAWFDLWPVPHAAGELLHTAADMALIALCSVVAWQALHPSYGLEQRRDNTPEGEQGNIDLWLKEKK